MSALVVLIAASLILASGFLFAFIRATKKGQYEDVYTPSVRILFDDFEGRQEATVQSHEVRSETLKQVQSDDPNKEKSQTTKKWN